MDSEARGEKGESRGAIELNPLWLVDRLSAADYQRIPEKQVKSL